MNSWLQLFFGVILGFVVHLSDYFLFAFYAADDDEQGKWLRKIWRQQKLMTYITAVIQQRNKLDQLLTASILFVGVQLILTLFLLTSSGNLVGIGLALGLNLYTLIQWFQWRSSNDVFNHQVAWQLKTSFSQSQIKWLFRGYLAIFILLCLLSLV